MPQLSKSTIKYPRTGRYYTLNSVQQKTKNIWIVFHGYGQLAEYFTKHFEDLDPSENFVIAPEGLSRFYLDGLTGRVGASWMTKDDRDDEIVDQSNYLNLVLQQCGINPRKSSCKIIVLGFSQGTTTAIRWLANNNIRPTELILWAGNFPHDVSATEHSAVFHNLSIHYVYGDNDPLLKDVNMPDQLVNLEIMGLKIKPWMFEGNHTMHRPTLAKIVDSFGS